MSREIYHGRYVAGGGGAVTLHTGAGRLFALLLSHNQTSAQTVTLYDNTAASGTVLAQMHLHPQQSPTYLRLGAAPGREEGLQFSHGLTVDPGTCDVMLWLAAYS